MKHYRVYISRSDGLTPRLHEAANPDNPRRFSYSLSVHDDDRNFDLPIAVNQLVLAQQFVTAKGFPLPFAVVLQAEDVGEFHEYTPVNVFASERGSAPVGLCENRILEHSFGVRMARNRKSGKAENYFLAGCVDTFDFRVSRPHGRETAYQLLTDGPLCSFWLRYWAQVAERLPLNAGYIVHPNSGVVHDVIDTKGGYIPDHLSFMRWMRAREQDHTDPMKDILGYVTTALNGVLQLLFDYRDGMESFNHQWGDGYVPQFFTDGARGGIGLLDLGVWLPLAVGLGYDIPDALNRNGAIIPPRAIPAQPATFKVKNEPLIAALIGQLWALQKYQYETLRVDDLRKYYTPYEAATAEFPTAGFHWIKSPEAGLRAYNRWDGVTSFLFSCRDTLARLWALLQFEIPRQIGAVADFREFYYSDVDKSGGWEVSFDTQTPSLIEVHPYSREPFYSFHAEPIATVSLSIPEQPAQSQPTSGGGGWSVGIAIDARVVDWWNGISNAWTDTNHGWRPWSEVFLDLAKKLISEAEGGPLTEAAKIALTYYVDKLQGTSDKEAQKTALKSARAELIKALKKLGSPSAKK